MYIRKNEHVRMLIIDDSDEADLQEMLVTLKQNFPAATIDSLTGFDGIEERIAAGKYHVIFLDALLHNWGTHKVFDRYGWKMIPYIRETSPQTRVIAISSMPQCNAKMLSAGAIKSIHKDLLLRRTEIKEDLSVA